LVALRSLRLQPILFGYKTPPIRFSQAGGQSAHKARPPNLELALTPLASSINQSISYLLEKKKKQAGHKGCNTTLELGHCVTFKQKSLYLNAAKFCTIVQTR